MNEKDSALLRKTVVASHHRCCGRMNYREMGSGGMNGFLLKGIIMFESLLIVIAVAASAPTTQSTIAEELARYYNHGKAGEQINWDREHLQEQLNKYNEKPKEPFSWDASMKQLGSSSPADRERAAAHLQAVMQQCWEDEQSGKAPWLATPWWGSSGENPARKLRESFVRAMQKAPAAPQFVPLIEWELRNEVQRELHEKCVAVLGKIDGPTADAFRRKLIFEPHSNAFVVSGAIDQLRERNSPLPPEELEALCQHHRKVIRDSARRLNAALNGPDPEPFDARAAVKSPAARKILDDLSALMIDLPAPDTPFVEITIRYMDKEQMKRTGTDDGWLVKQDADSVTIYTPYGQFETYKNNEPGETWETVKIDGEDRNRTIKVTKSITIARPGIDAYVKKIVSVRAKGNEDFALSAQGGLTGQFEGRGASLPEIILSVWLDRANNPALTAAVFLPALDTLYEDQGIVDIARNHLGDLLGYRMLIAFDGDRDFERALSLARTFVKRYPKTRFYEYAQGFCVELPRRMEDFKTFKLPTPKEWTEMKQRMSRQQQIDFLCARLRLLNCFQRGQPGGYDPSETQYAEPCGLSENAAWGQRKGKTVVINPLVELTGQKYGFIDDETKRSKGLELTIADIPALAPHLRENWYQLTVGFWRDFAADRYLGRTREEIFSIIDGLAHRDICEEEKFKRMSDVEKEKQIEKIIAWARANKGRSDEDLIIERVQNAIARKADWIHVENDIHRLVERKNSKGLEFLEHYLGDKEQNGWYIRSMLEELKASDPRKAAEWARKFLTHKEDYLRLQAALLVLGSGDKETAIPILASTLPVGSQETFGQLAVTAVDNLLDIGSPEATKAALGVLVNPGIHRPDAFNDFSQRFRAQIVTRLAKAGHPEAYRLYLELLDVKGNEFGKTGYGEPVAQQATKEILEQFGKEEPELQKARASPDFESRRILVRRWIETKTAVQTK